VTQKTIQGIVYITVIAGAFRYGYAQKGIQAFSQIPKEVIEKVERQRQNTQNYKDARHLFFNGSSKEEKKKTTTQKDYLDFLQTTLVNSVIIELPQEDKIRIKIPKISKVVKDQVEKWKTNNQDQSDQNNQDTKLVNDLIRISPIKTSNDEEILSFEELEELEESFDSNGQFGQNFT
jgi:hypothetical protein